jgi:hypothetical protein
MNHPAVSSAPFHTVIHIGILAADTLFVGGIDIICVTPFFHAKTGNQNLKRLEGNRHKGG